MVVLILTMLPSIRKPLFDVGDKGHDKSGSGVRTNFGMGGGGQGALEGTDQININYVCCCIMLCVLG